MDGFALWEFQVRSLDTPLIRAPRRLQRISHRTLWEFIRAIDIVSLAPEAIRILGVIHAVALATTRQVCNKRLLNNCSWTNCIPIAPVLQKTSGRALWIGIVYHQTLQKVCMQSCKTLMNIPSNTQKIKNDWSISMVAFRRTCQRYCSSWSQGNQCNASLVGKHLGRALLRKGCSVEMRSPICLCKTLTLLWVFAKRNRGFRS